MTGTTFGALVTQNNGNIRKALKGGVLTAPTTASLPTALTAGSPPALQALTGFSSMGFFDSTGAVISEKLTVQDVEAWGKTSPVRTDIELDVTSVKVVALETNAAVLAARFGVSSITPNETTGEVVITSNISPVPAFQRVLVLSQDGPAGGEWWVGKLLPYASVTAIGDESWNSAKSTMTATLTFTGYEDPVAGFACQTFYAGPGWLAGLAGAGLS